MTGIIYARYSAGFPSFLGIKNLMEGIAKPANALYLAKHVFPIIFYLLVRRGNGLFPNGEAG